MARWQNSGGSLKSRKTSLQSTHLTPVWSHDELCGTSTQKIPKAKGKTSLTPTGMAKPAPRHVQSALHKGPGSTLRGVDHQQDNVAAIKPVNPSCTAGKVRDGMQLVSSKLLWIWMMWLQNNHLLIGCVEYICGRHCGVQSYIEIY